MLQLLHFRLKVMTVDGRVFVGQMLAFDRYMNLVLSECEEFRKIKPKKGSTAKEREEKRALGLIVLRGETIVSLSVEGPPTSAEKKMRGPAVQGLTPLVGPGVGRPAGRGIPAAAPGVAPAGTQSPSTACLILGLAGPIRGVGMMMPPGMPGKLFCVLPMINGRYAANGNAAWCSSSGVRPHCSASNMTLFRFPPGAMPPGFRPGMPRPPM